MSPPEKSDTPAWSRGHATPLEYHRMLLDDAMRVDAYDRAIRALVRPGDVVLDLGCGSGILSMFAAQRGAKVHAVESMPIAKLAATFFEQNNLSEQITLHHIDARDLELDEPVDLLISEFMGRFLLDDGMLPVIASTKHLLAVDARCCPSQVELMLAPVGDFQLFSVEFFKSRYFGLDLSAAMPYALNYCYQAQLSPWTLMSPAQSYYLYVAPETAPPFDKVHRFRCTRGGKMLAVAGWFIATLTPEILLSTAPGMENHWGQYLFPLPATQVEEGDVLEFHLSCDAEAEEQIWHWRGGLYREKEQLLTFDLESKQRLGERPKKQQNSRKTPRASSRDPRP